MAGKRRWFACGAGRATRHPGSDVVLFQWNGRSDGSAHYSDFDNKYRRKGAEYSSFAALLRAVEAEHLEKET